MSNHNSARDAVIVGAARTPMGKFMGALSPLSATELGGLAIQALWSGQALIRKRCMKLLWGWWSRPGRVRLQPGRRP